MIVILGQLDIDPEDFAQASYAAAEVSRASVLEEGCFHYAFAADLNHPNRLQLSEWWRDQAALDVHFGTPHIQVFRQAMAQLRVVKRVVKRFEASPPGDLNPKPL